MKKTINEKDAHKFLSPTSYIDSDSFPIMAFTKQVVDGLNSDKEKAIRLYHEVRDSIRYNPYRINFCEEQFKASWILKIKSGFCVQKAILMAAVARAAGIPSRLGFADVRNHLAPDRLTHLMRTDVFFFHGYTELFIENRWIKVTPAFDRGLCEYFGVKPLGFDGETDSMFQPFDGSGNRYMEYLRDYGCFEDFPLNRMIRVFKHGYPHLFGENGTGWPDISD